MKFNRKTLNEEGAPAYKQNPEIRLTSILLTSLLKDKFYRKYGEERNEIRQLLGRVNHRFAAKACVYARTKFGLRSVTHLLASELARYASGKSWARNFYNNIVYRPDDMMEIIAYHNQHNGKIPNAMKRGFSDAFNRFDEYQLAKYRGEDKEISLVDVVNIAHPKPKEHNENALNKLVRGELRSSDTWETELTKAGGSEEKKKEAWDHLVRTGKIGYFALLRNLRNIHRQAPHLTDDVVAILTNEKRIRKSLVLPFRFLQAVEVMSEEAGSNQIVHALHIATDISLGNVPEFDGHNLVAIDVSGSMTGSSFTNYADMSKTAAMLGLAIYKKGNCDLMTFDNYARYNNIGYGNIFMMINSLSFTGRGTNIQDVFDKADRLYDRIFILTDGQGWMGNGTAASNFYDYRKRFNVDTYLYNVDLAGYGTTQIPERNLICLAGFSSEIFNIIKNLENMGSMVDQINSIKL